MSERELQRGMMGLRCCRRISFRHRQPGRPGTRHKSSSHGWRALSLVGTVLLAGCSLAPFIAQNSIDYNETVEAVTNSVLVTNILRGRDGAPLYFSDLSLIRGQLQLSAQAQVTQPFGPVLNSTSRPSVQSGPFTINSTPGFDVAPLNTKNFAQGMLDGINVNVFAYFINRPIDAKTFLNLVVSRVDVYEGGQLTKNFNPGHGLEQQIERWTSEPSRSPGIGVSKESPALGPLISADELSEQKNALANIVQVNTAGLELSPVDTTGLRLRATQVPEPTHKNYRLFKPVTKYVLCVPGPNGGNEAVGIASPGAAKAPSEPPIPKSDSGCSKLYGGASESSTRKRRYVLVLRSVEAIFYYLGQVLRDPESAPIQFHIYNYPPPNARFRVNYRGETYFVRESSDGDPTITILAILNDLLNLNRDANEIPSTKTVATTSP